MTFVRVLREQNHRRVRQSARFENWSFWPISRPSVSAHSRCLCFHAVPQGQGATLVSGLDPLFSFLAFFISDREWLRSYLRDEQCQNEALIPDPRIGESQWPRIPVLSYWYM